MNTNLNNASKCFAVYDGNNPVAFCAILHLMHPMVKNAKRVHRLVVLPDYQGIGIGTKFLNLIAEHYKRQGFDMFIKSSAMNIIQSLNRSDKWKLNSFGLQKFNPTNKLNRTCRYDNKTASFKYIGDKKK